MHSAEVFVSLYSENPMESLSARYHPVFGLEEGPILAIQ